MEIVFLKKKSRVLYNGVFLDIILGLHLILSSVIFIICLNFPDLFCLFYYSLLQPVIKQL